jgi:hypothetical protein
VVSGCVLFGGLVLAPTGALAAAPETPVTGPVQSITASSAVFAGVLNPHATAGGEAESYEFVYRQSASECRGEGSLTAGSGAAAGLPAEAVGPVEVTELLPNATYSVCLLVRNEAGEEATGSVVTFTTVAVKPSISEAATKNQTAEAAELTALVDPNGSATTYRFEWGTSSAYESSVPVPAGSVGAGWSGVAVSAHLTGLAANTTYHWRLVASSGVGVAETGDQAFVYDTERGGLPDGRAYEMVTPVDKNGAKIGPGSGSSEIYDVAENGSRVIAMSTQCFAGSVSCTEFREPTLGDPFAFSRTSSGWATSGLMPAAPREGADVPRQFSAETDALLFSAPTQPLGVEDWDMRQPNGSVVDIGPTRSPGTFADTEMLPYGTADLSHLVVDVGGVVWPFDGSLGQESLYEYSGVGNSQPDLVGVSGPAGSTDLISLCGTSLGGVGVVGATSRYNAVSASGDTVFFSAFGRETFPGECGATASPATDELYARIDGSQTVPISQRSPSGCSGGCLASPAGDAEFEGASADGTKAFFTSTQQLTNDASEDAQAGDTARKEFGGRGCLGTTGSDGCNLYEYDFDRPVGENLVDVSAGDTSGGGPRVREVAAISSDGSHVYFVAEGVLTDQPNDQGQTAQNGAYNLYVYERDPLYPEGRVQFITALQYANELELGQNVTPDGRFLVFTSTARLTADDSSTTGAAQVFMYDAQTDELVRVSIGEHGFNDNGNAGKLAARIVPMHLEIPKPNLGPVRTDPTMSNDGAYVFFESPVGLTPQALNEVPIGTGATYAENVYEYHAGQVYLISGGHDVSGGGGNASLSSVELLGSDASGANVFFTTAEQLVPQDTDTQIDIYDARICTQSEPCVQQTAGSSCEGEACRGSFAGLPAEPAAATAGFSGPGNLTPTVVTTPKPKAKAKAKAKKRKRKAKRRNTRRKAKPVKRGTHRKARG